jgi:hypothetical protein
MVHYEGEFDFAPTPAGTRLSADGRFRFKGVWRLMSPLAGREIRKESRTELEDIKRAVESSASARAA